MGYTRPMSLLDAAQDLLPELRELSPRIESERRVPADIATKLAEQGFHRCLVPAGLGGGETHPRTFVQILETLAQGDAATAWTVMTGATTGLLAAYLPESGARALFQDPACIPCGVFAPLGQATEVDGGFRVRGRWAFASGIDNATLHLGGALVRREGSEKPELRSFFLPPGSVQLQDTWHTAGLCGTGSHHMVVEDAFVPLEHSVCVFTDAPWAEGPLYRFSLFGLLALGVAGVGLGIARAALDHIVEHAQKTAPGRRALADTERVQLEVGKMAGHLAAARALVQTSIQEAWDAAEPSLQHRAALRLAATHAAAAAVDVVDDAYRLGGSAAFFSASPLQRHLRDVRTLMHHIMVNESSYRPIGRLRLGLPIDTSQL